MHCLEAEEVLKRVQLLLLGTVWWRGSRAGRGGEGGG